jgi:hypothetical protein
MLPKPIPAATCPCFKIFTLPLFLAALRYVSLRLGGYRYFPVECATAKK